MKMETSSLKALLRYEKPSMELILFDSVDILTESNELPFIPAEEETETDFE